MIILANPINSSPENISHAVINVPSNENDENIKDLNNMANNDLNKDINNLEKKSEKNDADNHQRNTQSNNAINNNMPIDEDSPNEDGEDNNREYEYID